MKHFFFSLATICALAVAPLFAGDMDKKHAKNLTDEQFLKKAAESGMFEVEASKLAEDKASSGNVKSFAKMMVSDHDRLNEQIKSLADKENVTLPTSLSDKKQSALDDLAKLDGAAFDKAYVDKMVKGHEKSVAAFKAKADSSDNEDVQGLAKNALPTLEGHLKQIKDLQSALK